MKLVLFDFDGTLTALDTTLPFGRHLAGEPAGRGPLARLVLALVLARFRLVSNTGLKRAFARYFLRGKPVAAVRQLALDFCRARLDSLVEPEVLGRLQTHVRNGDRVFLISANFACLLEPLVERWTLSGVIATRAEVTAGVYSGRLLGAACHGQAKLARARAEFTAADLQAATAYGNLDDMPLLIHVGQGFLVGRAAPAGPFGRVRRFLRLLAGNQASTSEPAPCTITPVMPAPASRSHV